MAILVDRADHISIAPRPAVQADATRLPFRGECFAAVAALWMLYYLDKPELALVEATRVLRPAGTFVACTSSRYNDPEFASVLPNWGEPFTFDAETASAIVADHFKITEVIQVGSAGGAAPRHGGGCSLPPRTGTKRRASFPAGSILEHTIDRREARLPDLGLGGPESRRQRP